MIAGAMDGLTSLKEELCCSHQLTDSKAVLKHFFNAVLVPDPSCL